MFSENLVEFVDILPTLVEAAGLPELEKCPCFGQILCFMTESHSLSSSLIFLGGVESLCSLLY